MRTHEAQPMLTKIVLFVLGTTALVVIKRETSYIVSCTSSHYDWARTELRKGLRAREGQTLRGKP